MEVEQQEIESAVKVAVGIRSASKELRDANTGVSWTRCILMYDFSQC